MQRRLEPWAGALSVMTTTVVLVVLDISDGSVRRFWSRHSFTSSVLAGLLVLLLTVLIVDRVARIRQLKNQSRAIAAQAAIISAQAQRAVQAITNAPSTSEAGEQASDELRTYPQILLVSAPVLIDAPGPRRFLETAQHLAAELFRVQQNAGADRTEAQAAVDQLREAAAPLLSALNREQQAAVSSDDADT